MPGPATLSMLRLALGLSVCICARIMCRSRCISYEAMCCSTRPLCDAMTLARDICYERIIALHTERISLWREVEAPSVANVFARGWAREMEASVRIAKRLHGSAPPRWELMRNFVNNESYSGKLWHFYSK